MYVLKNLLFNSSLNITQRHFTRKASLNKKISSLNLKKLYKEVKYIIIKII